MYSVRTVVSAGVRGRTVGVQLVYPDRTVGTVPSPGTHRPITPLPGYTSPPGTTTGRCCTHCWVLWYTRVCGKSVKNGKFGGKGVLVKTAISIQTGTANTANVTVETTNTDTVTVETKTRIKRWFCQRTVSGCVYRHIGGGGYRHISGGYRHIVGGDF